MEMLDQKTLLLAVLGCMLLPGILCVWLGRLLVRKTRRGWAAFLPLVGYILFLGFLLRYAVPLLEQTGDIVLPERTVTPEQAALGLWMTRIGMIGTVILAVLTGMMDGRLKCLLLARDAAVRGGIVPDRLALVFMLIPLGVICLVPMGTFISYGDGGALLILLMGGGLMAAFLLKDQFTRLTIDGGTLTLRRFGKERRYPVSDICAIQWKSCRGITGRVLVIVFCDGKSFWFLLDSFRGVQNTYHELTGRLNKMKE